MSARLVVCHRFLNLCVQRCFAPPAPSTDPSAHSGWYLPTLQEFFPKNPCLLGMNRNRGQVIYIRLRPAHDKNTFLPLEEELVGTMLHEFTHNEHGPHDVKFYKLLDGLNDEYDALRASGYSGEGFLGNGTAVGVGVSHNLSPHEARLRALAEAERRAKLARLLGPPGGRSLGGVKARPGVSPRELAAQAAERRARDAQACGHGEGQADDSVQEEQDRAEKDSEGVKVDNSAHPVPDAAASALGEGPSGPSTGGSQQGGNETESESDGSDLEIVEQPLPRLNPNATAKGPTRPMTSKPAGTLQVRPQKQAGVNTTTTAHAKPSHKPKASPWNCHICTFENTVSSAGKCEMCDAPRSSGSGVSGTVRDTSSLDEDGFEVISSVSAPAKKSRKVDTKASSSKSADSTTW